MFTLLHTLIDQLERLGRWFDLHFGWFFTNGMKQ
jgi:hypothetical protein